MSQSEASREQLRATLAAAIGDPRQAVDWPASSAGADDWGGKRLLPLPDRRDVFMARARSAITPAVGAAVQMISDSMARVTRGVTGGRRRSHPVAYLLQNPTDVVNRHEFWKMINRDELLDGYGVAWIRRDRGMPVELVPAKVRQCRWVGMDDTRRRAQYDLQLIGSMGAATVRVLADDVLGCWGPGFDGLTAPSRLTRIAASVLGLYSAATRHQERVLAPGMGSVTALTQDPNMMMAGEAVGQEKIDELRDAIAEDFAASAREGSVPFLPPGIKLDRLNQLTSVDLQVVDLLRWIVEEVARVYNVSPVRLGQLVTGMRTAGYEQQSADYVRYTIGPRAEALDEECTVKLLTPEERLAGLRVRSFTDRLSTGTLSERIGAADKAVARAGIWTINEGRALTGKGPIAGGDRLLPPKGSPKPDDTSGRGDPDDAGDPDE